MQPFKRIKFDRQKCWCVQMLMKITIEFLFSHGYPVMELSCEIYDIPKIVQVMGSEIEVSIQENDNFGIKMPYKNKKEYLSCSRFWTD